MTCDVPQEQLEKIIEDGGALRAIANWNALADAYSGIGRDEVVARYKRRVVAIQELMSGNGAPVKKVQWAK